MKKVMEMDWEVGDLEEVVEVETMLEEKGWVTAVAG